MPPDVASPFSPTLPVRKGAYPITMSEALTAAKSAGYVPTARSRPGRAHVQRAWNRAAGITEVPSGVVVRPAWTSAQIAVLVTVLLLLFVGAVL